MSFDPHVSEWGNPKSRDALDLISSKVEIRSERGELKHLSTLRKINQVRDTLSSGERKG